MSTRVFLSYATKDQARVKWLKSHLSARLRDFEFDEYSLRNEPDVDWKNSVMQLISNSSFVLCVVGDSTPESEAVKWELDKSVSLGKTIVLVGIEGRPSIRKTDQNDIIGPLRFDADLIASELNKLAKK